MKPVTAVGDWSPVLLGNLRRCCGLGAESSQLRARKLGVCALPCCHLSGVLLGPSLPWYFWFARHARVLSGSLGCGSDRPEHVGRAWVGSTEVSSGWGSSPAQGCLRRILTFCEREVTIHLPSGSGKVRGDKVLAPLGKVDRDGDD